MADHLATATTQIKAGAARVWEALTDPVQIKAYMFGTTVDTDWKPGSRITWSGEWEGKPYEDKGEIVEFEPGRRLKVTHYSPLTGQPDVPENYHTLTYDLSEDDGVTTLELSQDNNSSDEEAEQSRQTWEGMLSGLKQQVEGG